jgi:mycothiol synthase
MELRAPKAEDRARILELLIESDLAETGTVTSTRADVDEMFSAPGLDHVDRARIQLDGDRVIALVMLHPAPWVGELRAQLIVAPDAAAGAVNLLGLIAEWSRADRPAPGPVTTTLFELPGFVARQALIDDGWQIVHSYTRMQGRLEADREVRLPNGVTIRAAHSTADLTAAHAVIEESVAGHWKHQRRSFDEFLRDQESRDGHNPELWLLAESDGEPAGAVIARDPPEHAWIAWLGVAPHHRQRGIANALLHSAFNELRRRGHETVGVDVDTHNQTGANAVYERAGMTVTLRADQWSQTFA